MGAKWCNQSITENKLRHTQTIELVAICDQFSHFLLNQLKTETLRETFYITFYSLV